MTLSLPRRAVVGAVLATSLVGAGLSAFAADAAAGACPSWTDPKGDASAGERGLPETGDANLDIVAVSVSTVGDAVVGKITSDALGAANSDAGDEFRITFSIGGATVQMYADRSNGVFGSPTPAVAISNGAAGFYNETTEDFGAATVAYDVKAKTVTITGKIAELTKALGKPATGLPVTNLVATTHDLLGVPGEATHTPLQYDTAPTKLTYVVGADCAGGAAPAPAPSTPAPSSAPTPAPAPSGAPAGDGPAPDCVDIKDPKGDASVNLTTNSATGTPNDPDLDITAFNFQTTAESLKGYIKIDKLGAKPSLGNGHRFLMRFMAGSKAVEVYAGQPDAAAGAINGALVATGQFAPAANGVRIGPSYGNASAYNGTVKTSAVFDVKNSRVVLTVDRATLDKALGTPLADGDVVKATSAGSGFFLPNGGSIGVDVAQAAKVDEQVYTIGDNKCFAPPASSAPSLSSVGATKAQFGDVAAVAAKLLDASGAPVAGKDVTFTLGASKATAKTGTDGVAKAALPVKEKAGKRVLTVTAGDVKTTSDFTVLVEKTVLKATGRKGVVTATLTDDDRKPVAGQVVTFTSGGKKVSAKTNSKGVATAKGFKPGSTVTVTYAGVSGQYAGAKTTAKA